MFGERDRGWWMLKKKVNYFGFQFRRRCKVSLSPRPGKVVDLDGFSKPGLWGHVPGKCGSIKGSIDDLGCGVMFQDNAVVSIMITWAVGPCSKIMR